MSHLSIAIRLIAPAAIVVLLSWLQRDSSLSRTFGLTRDAPDEFTVVTRAPLSMPPDFTLRPPEPGAARPQEQSDRSLAESALVPDAALGGAPAGVSPGQAALVRDAGGGAPADIRQRVDQEARLDASDDSFIDRLLYWRKPDTQQAVVDPTKETQRLRQNAALGQSPETGETPIIREKKKGWFQEPVLLAVASGPDSRITRRSGDPRPSPARASGMFSCACGQSLLIAGYEPRNFLGIAIQCAACGRISETPGLPHGAPPPPAVTLVERGAENPPSAIDQRHRPDQPRGNRTPRGAVSAAIDRHRSARDQRRAARRCGVPAAPLDRASRSIPRRATTSDHALAWAVAHFRGRLRDPEWTSFADDADIVAVTIIAAFRDLFASWVHHPLFGAMVNTAAAQGFSLHAMAMFGAAKSLASAGNRVGFVPTAGAQAADCFVSVGAGRAGSDVGRGATGSIGSSGRTARKARPDGARGGDRGDGRRCKAASIGCGRGILVLSGGISHGGVDQLLLDSINAALASHGKRHRGLAAVAAIFPKVGPTGQAARGAVRLLVLSDANRNHAVGQSVRIGSRADHTGVQRCNPALSYQWSQVPTHAVSAMAGLDPAIHRGKFC